MGFTLPRTCLWKPEALGRDLIWEIGHLVGGDEVIASGSMEVERSSAKDNSVEEGELVEEAKPVHALRLERLQLSLRKLQPPTSSTSPSSTSTDSSGERQLDDSGGSRGSTLPDLETKQEEELDNRPVEENTKSSKEVEGLEQELIEDIEGLAIQYLDNQTDLVQVRTKLEQVQEERGKVEEEADLMRTTMDELERESRRNREEWASREGELRRLTREVADQGEALEKGRQERRRLMEEVAMSREEVQLAEQRLNILNNVKTKLETSLEETEEEMEKEKRRRAIEEKGRRKAEAEAKMVREVLVDKEVEVAGLQQNLTRKEKEVVNLGNKLGEEQSLVAQGQRQVADLGRRVEQLEEEGEVERSGRMRAEKERCRLEQELAEADERLEEAGLAASLHVEVARKREAELVRLRKELEDAKLSLDGQLSAKKKKHLEAVAEMNEQVDVQTKLRKRYTIIYLAS